MQCWEKTEHRRTEDENVPAPCRRLRITPSAVGNATTVPGGAIYTAPRYQVARLAYRITNRGILVSGREMPLYFDFQASRNVGTNSLRDAIMATANFGQVRFDLGLTRSLQWQNLFFIQNERRPNNPAAQFFVLFQRRANTTYRYLGQPAFSF